jgi:DNA primase
MSGLDYRAVRQQIPIAAVLDLLQFVPVDRSGQQLRGPCPVHKAESAGSRSFSANLAANTFRCFSCGAAGNQLDLWSLATGRSLFEAAIDLCNKANLDIPWLQPAGPREREAEKRNP